MAQAEWGTQGCSSPWREGITQSSAEHVWGGCSPPVRKQGLAPSSSEAQWPQRVALAWPKGCPGTFVQACEGPQGQAPHCRLCVRSEEAVRDGTSLAQEQSCVCSWCSLASLVPDAAGLHQIREGSCAGQGCGEDWCPDQFDVQLLLTEGKDQAPSRQAMSPSLPLSMPGLLPSWFLQEMGP